MPISIGVKRQTFNTKDFILCIEWESAMKTKLFVTFPLIFMILYTSFSVLATDSTQLTKGGYVVTTKNEYIAMPLLKYSSTKIKNDAKEASNFIYRYILNPKPNAVLSAEDVHAFFIKGNHQAHHFSLHKLEKRILSTKESFSKNNGKANKSSLFYYAGKELIKVNRKRTEYAKSNFFVPQKPLSPGIYVIWIDWVFWVFEVE